MVAARGHAGSAEALPSGDRHAIRALLDAHTHLRQLAREGGDAVRLLHAQLGRVTDLGRAARGGGEHGDRKSTRLNSSHSQISYAVFCLKKKKKNSRMRRASG